MRMVRNVAMALVVLASATMANAASFVWYETTNTAGNGPAGPAGGAQGQALDLTCNTEGADGSCSWNITMRVAIGPGGVLGWSSDLVTAPGNGVSASAPAIVAGPFNNSTFPGTPGSGAALLLGSHGQTFSAVQPQTMSLLTFTLVRSFTSGDLSGAAIRAGTSADASVVWTNETTFDYEDVGFGPNPAGTGAEGTLGALPSINVQNVPEPTSLGLLALGALAVIRRRVAC